MNSCPWKIIADENLKFRLYNSKGEEFLDKYLPSTIDKQQVIAMRGTNFPFTSRNESRVIDIAIHNEIIQGRGTDNFCVYLDLTDNSAKTIEKKIPHLIAKHRNLGADICQEPIEISLYIQHFNGGVRLTEKAETSLPGLFVAGEVAGGQHGADRPGGNSLADCLVFGKIAGQHAAERAHKMTTIHENVEIRNQILTITNQLVHVIESENRVEIQPLIKTIQKAMWCNVSTIRNESGLRETLQTLKQIKQSIHADFSTPAIEDYLTLTNLLQVGELVTRSC